MKLGLGGGGSGAKQSPVLIVVLVLIILAAVFFVGRNFIGGGGEELPAPGTVPMPGMPGPGMPGEGPGGSGMPPPPGPGPGPEGMPSPGAPPPVAPPPPGATEGAPASPPAAPAGAPGAGSASPAPPQPVASAPPASPAQPAPSARGQAVAPKRPTYSVKVFRTVTVDVPEGWGVDIAAAKTAAVFTNGRAHFELHAPDPTAASAKEIADSAVRTLGGTVSAESAENVAGHSAHVYSVTRGGASTRVVGLDAPTRLVLVAYVRGGSFGDYRSTFDQMQSSLKFSTP